MTNNIRGALCLAEHAYCIESSQLWQGEAPYSDLMYSFIILFNKISNSIWEKKIVLVGIMAVCRYQS